MINLSIVLRKIKMNEKEIIQTQKGIWIKREPDIPLYYSTWLREQTENVVSFIPFEHTYEPLYLGSVGFLDIKKFPNLIARFKIDKGLLQNHFYPLGGTAKETRPELVGRGLARRIEFEIAKDLSKEFPKDTLVVIIASSDSHLKYCHKIGIIPDKAMSLEEYITKLNNSCKL